MVTAFDEVPEKAFNAVKITATADRPSPGQLEVIDGIVASLFGFALRYGVAESQHLAQYEYGYLLPRGASVRGGDLQTLETRLVEDTHLESPDVRLVPMLPSESELERMAVVGTPPEEALSGLFGLREAVEDAKDEQDDH